MAINNSEKTFKKLSIQVSLDGLSFCRLNREENLVEFYKHIDIPQPSDPGKLLKLIEIEYNKEAELKAEVDELELLFTNELYSLVPAEYFSETNESDFLKFNTRILKTDFIAHDEISGGNMVNVYVPYANITNFFFEKYGEFEYKHSISILIESLLALLREKEAKVYLNNRKSNFDLVVIEDGDVLLCNSFSYSSPEDFLYYLLFTAEQLGLDPNKFELILLGDIQKDSEIFELCYMYIKNISFFGPFHNFEFPENSEAALTEFTLINSL
ncbi:DUF3822 family protein [Salegentibacter sp. HM20]